MVLIGLFWLLMGINLQAARRLAGRGDPLLLDGVAPSGPITVDPKATPR